MEQIYQKSWAPLFISIDWGCITNETEGTVWIEGTATVLGVNRNDVANSRRIDDPVWFNTTVELEEEAGSGYMGTLELFHLLHCLVREDPTL